MIYTKEVQEAIAAGYSLDQVKALAIDEYNEALAAGYNRNDVRAVLKETYGLHAGTSQEDLDDAKYLASLLFESLDENTKTEPSSNATKSNVSKAQSIGEAFAAGYQNSVVGLTLRGQNPTIGLTEDSPFLYKAAAALAQGGGDLPAYIIGGIFGGAAGTPIAAATGPAAPVTEAALAGAGAGFVAGYWRNALLQAYEKGSATDAIEFGKQTISNAIAGLHEAIPAATAGMAGKLVSPFASNAVSKIKSPTLASAAETSIVTSSEVAAMSAATTALSGKMPSAEDFLLNAITLGAFKAGGAYSTPVLKSVNLYLDKFIDTYRETGLTPDAVNKLTLIDPSVKERALSINQRIVEAEKLKYHRAQAVIPPEMAKARGLDPAKKYTEEDINKSIENARKVWIENHIRNIEKREVRNKPINEDGSPRRLTPEEKAEIRRRVESDAAKNPLAFAPQPKEHAGKWLYGSKYEATRQAISAHEGTKLVSPEAFYEEVWLPKGAEYLKLSGNSDATMAKIVREYMQSAEGKKELEARDPEFFKNNPNWWEGKSAIADEKLIPTAKAIFENPSDSFINFLQNHVWDYRLAEKISSHPRTVINRSSNFPQPDGTFRFGLPIKFAGIIQERSSAQGGTRYFIFNKKMLKPSAKRVTGETPYDKAFEKFDKRISIGEAPERTWSEKIDNIIYHGVDSFHALNTGAERGKRSEAYVDAIVSNGAAGRATFMIDIGMINAKGETVGRSLKSIINGVAAEGGDMKEFSFYLAAKHFKEQYDKGISSAIDPDSVVSVLKGPKAELYEKYAKQLKEYNVQLLDYQLDTGLISKSRYDKLRKEFKNSVPLDKMVEAFEPELQSEALRVSGDNVAEGQALSEQAARDRMAKVFGAKKNQDGKLYIDPVESQIRATFLTTRLAMQNNAKRTAAETFGVKIDSPQAKAPNMTTITYLDKGKTRRQAVPKEIREATLSMDSGTFQMYNAAMRGLAQATHVFRIGTTGHPAFALKNLFIDQLTAWVQSPRDVNFYPFISAIKGFSEMFKTKALGKESMYTEWLKDGGSNASLASLGRNFTQSMIKELQKTPVQNLVKDPRKHWKEIYQMISPTHAFQNAAKGLYRGLAAISEYSDQATRVGMYLESRKAGYSGKESAYLSRMSTVDFARSGATTKAVNSIIAFLNARIQGMARLTEAIKDDPVNVASKITRGIIIPSFLLGLVQNDIIQSNRKPDDPLYPMAETLRQAPNWITSTYWMVPVTSMGVVLRIPKPHELATFAAPVESFVDYMFKVGTGDEITFLEQLLENGFLGGIYDTLVPNLIPTTMLGPIEVMSNYSFFTGQSLIPAHLENLVPALQYRPGTTSTARYISEQLFKMFPDMNSNAITRFASPIGIDHIVRSWGGAYGQTFSEVLGKIAEATGLYEKAPAPAKTVEDLPFIKNFMVKYPSAGTKDLMAFNAEANAMQQRYNSIRAGTKSLDIHNQAIAKTLMTSTAFANLQPMRQALSRMSQMVELINVANTDPESKRIQIENIYIQMTQIATQGRKLIKQIEKEIKNAGRE